MNDRTMDSTGYLSISEMAKIMDISRQTLIYYDKIHLFRPIYVNPDNGYRYYSATQLPLIREICFMKSIGISLKEIRDAQSHPNLTDTIDLLREQSDLIREEMDKLQLQKWELEKRIYIYEHSQNNEDYAPLIQKFPERILICCPWDEDNLTAEGIHQILQKVWSMAKSHGLLPPRRWGTLLKKDEVIGGTSSHGAMVCCQVDEIPDGLPYTTLPSGEYVCMPKFGMPYQTGPLNKLFSWVKQNKYEIIGDIYDECLMDASFYVEEKEFDFSEIQIPVEKN